jgi:acyl-CoA thioesterase-1
MKNNITIMLAVTVLCLTSLLAGCEQRSAPTPTTQQQPVYAGTIVAVGDSLTAGLGVKEEDAYPAQLERILRDAGLNWRVINAGISGETSSGTLSRINWVLKLKPDIVILETGANDGLRGIDPALTRNNIDETVRILMQNRVVVVLAGMRMFTNLGRTYTNAFAGLYPAVAGKHGLILVPFFLEGVAGNPALNQTDGIHPIAEGYGITAKTIAPYVQRAIRKKGDADRGKPGK